MKEKLSHLPAGETPGVAVQDTLAQAGRKVLAFQFAEMLRQEPGTRQGEEIESLHDMRVATRRMRAAFDVFQSAFPPKTIRLHLKGLRAVGRALGSVRDLDVLIEDARRFQGLAPSEQAARLDPLLQTWMDRRDQARQEMLVHLDSPEYETFKEGFYNFLTSPRAGSKKHTPVPDRQPICDRIPILIYTRLAEARAFEPRLPDASIEELHSLRIELKKLRYTVEFFREVLGDRAKAVINDLKLLQDHLGRLHDAQVAIELLNGFIAAWEQAQSARPIAERLSSEAVAAYIADRHAERHQLLITFPEVWQGVMAGEFRQNIALAIAGMA